MILEIVEGALLLGSFVYHRWLEDRPPPVRPADIELPRVDEGTPIPLIYGRCRVRAPILAWSGNYNVPNGTTIAVYSLDALFVIGIPFYLGRAALMLNGIFYGDVKFFTLVSSDPGMQFFSADFTGSSLEPSGSGEYFDGLRDQNIGFQTTLTSQRMIKAGVNPLFLPGYPNLACCSFVTQDVSSDIASGLTIGTSPDIRSLSFEVRSLSTGSNADLGNSLTDDADPAAVILDLLTSPFGKLGLPASRIDTTSFQAASSTLFSEGHGYSRSIEQAEEASSIIDDILRQTDGLIYEEPTTGKIVYRLVRNDYDVSTLDDVNPDNATPADGAWYSVQGWSELPNQVRVTFTDRTANYANGAVVAQNGANSTDQVRLRSIDITFVGCNDKELARKLAARELAVVSRPIVKATVVVNRSFYLKRPGDVVTLTWPQLGISGMVMRIVRVDLGQLHDGKITLDMIRDVFDVTVGAFPAP
ncbi:MAG TPA: phage tail protein [Kofleriaceae bacterium]|nr:phage tail protein [Kofleriaceae bacterium]